MFYLILLIICIIIVVLGLVLVFGGLFIKDSTYHSSTNKPSYPYRPDVERRTPDGSITTDGYAACHPTEFLHWKNGPDILGEHIYLPDWEDWRINYYGE